MRAGGLVPKRTSHIGNRAVGRTLCGRPVKGWRVHQSWPICKTCRRISAKHRRGWSVIFGADGWSIPQAWGVSSNTTSANTIRVVWRAA